MNTATAIDNEAQTIGTNLAKALLAVQQEIGDVEKGAENPYFDSKYADLSSVIDTVKPVLNKHGIVFLQLPAVPKFEGTIALATILIHAESGESVQAVAEVPLSKNDPQAYGSAMTYTRRYSLVSVIGLKTVDDDGNAASSPTIKKPQPQPTIAAKPGGFKLGGNKAKPAATVAPQKNNAKPKIGLFPKVATQTPDQEENAEA
jgi:hypothetical protein